MYVIRARCICHRYNNLDLNYHLVHVHMYNMLNYYGIAAAKNFGYTVCEGTNYLLICVLASRSF